eukprot:1149234-Pelagomonas_calceolata.AAC.6
MSEGMRRCLRVRMRSWSRMCMIMFERVGKMPDLNAALEHHRFNGIPESNSFPSTKANFDTGEVSQGVSNLLAWRDDGSSAPPKSNYI